MSIDKFGVFEYRSVFEETLFDSKSVIIEKNIEDEVYLLYKIPTFFFETVLWCFQLLQIPNVSQFHLYLKISDFLHTQYSTS